MGKISPGFITILLVISLPFNLLLTAKNSPGMEKLKGFPEFVNVKMKEWQVPGLAVCIVKQGKVIFSGGFGFRDVKRKLKVTPKTLFALGSTTKAFTATAAGILVDDGKLDWNKPIKAYLPSFKLKDSFASARITTRDLLCHRSGLPRHDAVWYNSSATRKQLVERLQYLDPAKDFRTTFLYQNLMYMMAGYLVGQITGNTWEQFVQERIFEPLGMTGSNFSVHVSRKTSDFALPYMIIAGKVRKIPFQNYETIGPAASINSNITDMAKWLLFNLSNGKFNNRRIISKKNLQQIHSPQMVIDGPIESNEYFYTSYGMGWFITSYRGHLTLWHAGGADGFTAAVSFMPFDSIGIVVLANLHRTRLRSIIGYYVYDRLLGLEPLPWEERFKKGINKPEKQAEMARKVKRKETLISEKPPQPLKDFTADYENPGYGIISIKKVKNRLKAVYNSITYTLKHKHANVFYIESFNARVTFFTNEKGIIDRVAAQLEPAVKDIVFTRVKEKGVGDPDQ